MANQQEWIKHYFSLLIHQFIHDPRHKNYCLVFKNDLGKDKNDNKTVGKTIQHVKGPNHELIQFPRDPHKVSYRYEVQFLNKHRDEEDLRRTIVHEFTHLYLFSTIGDHEHDDNFYSWMEHFENWLDKNQNLTPRKDKSQDLNQHVNKPIKINADKDQILVEQYLFIQLVNLIMFSPDLNTLEKNYWNIIQNNSLYSSEKTTFPLYADNKTELDSYFFSKKEFFQLPKRIEQLRQEKESEWWMWISITIIGLGIFIISAILIIWWCFKKKKKHWLN